MINNYIGSARFRNWVFGLIFLSLPFILFQFNILILYFFVLLLVFFVLVCAANPEPLLIVIIFLSMFFQSDFVFRPDYFAVCISLFFIFAKKNIAMKFDSIFMFLYCMFTSAILSLYNTPSLFYSFSGIFSFIEGLLFWLLIINIKDTLTKNDWLFLVSCFLLLITFSLCIKAVMMGFVFFITDKANIKIGLGSSNFIGTFFLLLFPMQVALIHKSKNKLFDLVIIFISFIGIALTLSRGTYLLFIVELLLIMFFSLRLIPGKKLFIYLCIISLLLFCFFLFFGEYINEIIKLVSMRGGTDAGRFRIWRTAIMRFWDHPFIGNGFYSSRVLLPLDGDNIQYYHNTVIQTIISTGILGLVVWFAFIVKVFSGIQKIWQNKMLCIGLFISIMHGMLENNFYIFHYNVMFMFVVFLLHRELKNAN